MALETRRAGPQPGGRVQAEGFFVPPGKGIFFPLCSAVVEQVELVVLYYFKTFRHLKKFGPLLIEVGLEGKCYLKKIQKNSFDYFFVTASYM